jgi:hypothetical protein
LNRVGYHSNFDGIRLGQRQPPQYDSCYLILPQD